MLTQVYGPSIYARKLTRLAKERNHLCLKIDAGNAYLKIDFPSGLFCENHLSSTRFCPAKSDTELNKKMSTTLQTAAEIAAGNPAEPTDVDFLRNFTSSIPYRASREFGSTFWGGEYYPSYAAAVAAERADFLKRARAAWRANREAEQAAWVIAAQRDVTGRIKTGHFLRLNR